MEVESLTCNNCGAPLQVPEHANYVTCAHCGSQLAVHRTDTASYTEVLGQIGERTERMSEDLESIRLQNELERIDREWQIERERYMIQGRHGSRSLPTSMNTVAIVVVGVIVVIFGIFWTGLASVMTGAASGIGGDFFPFSVCFPLFGLAFVGIAIFTVISSVVKSQQYRDAEQRYLQHRNEVLRQMEHRR